MTLVLNAVFIHSAIFCRLFLLDQETIRVNLFLYKRYYMKTSYKHWNIKFNKSEVVSNDSLTTYFVIN